MVPVGKKGSTEFFSFSHVKKIKFKIKDIFVEIYNCFGDT